MSDQSSNTENYIRKFYQCIDEEKWDVLEELFSDGITYYRPGYKPLIGQKAILVFYKQTRIVSKGRHSIDVFIENNEDVSCIGRFEGTAKDGTSLLVKFCDYFKIKGNHIFYRETFFFSPLI